MMHDVYRNIAQVTYFFVLCIQCILNHFDKSFLETEGYSSHASDNKELAYNEQLVQQYTYSHARGSFTGA